MRSAENASTTGIRRKLLFALVILVGFLVAAEITGWCILEFTELGELAKANPAMAVDDLDQLYPVVHEEPIRTPTGFTHVEVRDMSAPELRERRLRLDSPPEGGAAAILGGSSPLGIGLVNRDTFWWRLDEADESDLHYFNLANIGDQSQEIRGQIARFVGFGGQPRLVVIYTGENDWNGFRYPNLERPAATRLDAVMLRSRAYTSLRTLTRSLAQSSVYEDVEAVRRESNFSLTRFPLDTRYRHWDPRMRAFIEESRVRLVAQLVANIEAVIDYSRALGARVVLVANPIRYRLSPAHNIAQVVSEKHSGTRFEWELVALLDTAVNALLVSDLETAKEALEEAYGVDPASSLTNHYLGYYWSAAGDPKRARSHFMTARDRTIGAGGLMHEINQAIRGVARSEDVGFVDLELVFARHTDASGNGLADELIMDWCHPNPRGAALVAEALGPVMAEQMRIQSEE